MLADLMYGKGFLKEKEQIEKIPEFKKILKKAEEYSKKGIEWHHHHLQPNCIFNNEKGKHSIVLEQKHGKLLCATYNEKPSGDLSKIEKLLYRNLTK